MQECEPGGGWGGKTKSVSEASRGSKNPTSEADGAGVAFKCAVLPLGEKK